MIKNCVLVIWNRSAFFKELENIFDMVMLLIAMVFMVVALFDVSLAIKIGSVAILLA